MISYEYDKDYVTCDIKIPHNKLSLGEYMNLYSILHKLKYEPSSIIRGIILKFKEYNVMIEQDYILMEKLYIMSINNIDNILVVINDLWRILKFPGFVTKYEIITKVCSRNINGKTIYNKHNITVPLYDILKILYNNNNSIFHYIPMDVINVICNI